MELRACNGDAEKREKMEVRGRGRGRGREFHNSSFDNQLSAGNHSGHEVDDTVPPSASSAVEPREENDAEAATDAIAKMNITSDVEQPSRYLQAVNQSSRNARLEESLFPPLPSGPSSNKQQTTQDFEGRGKNTMAARLQRRNKIGILHSSRARTLLNHNLANRSSAVRPTNTPGFVSSAAIPAPSWGARNYASTSSSSLSTSIARTETDHVRGSAASSSRASSSKNGVSHSKSAPNLVDVGMANPTAKMPVSSESSQPILSVQDVQSANKSLVDRIHSSLGMDEDKFTAFKEISGEYRQGQIDTWEYLAYVQQFGLTHLVVELARLCPDPRKQRELIDMYNANFVNSNLLENKKKDSDSLRKTKGKALEKSSLKGKGNLVDNGHSQGEDKVVGSSNSSKKEALADNFINTVRKLQANSKASDEVEVLSKDGYRTAKGKAKLAEPASEQHDAGGRTELNVDGSSSDQNGGLRSKQRKKSKFHRIRLGDGSAAALFQLGRSDASPEHEEEATESRAPSEGLPVRGVWRNNGGTRLMAKARTESAK